MLIAVFWRMMKNIILIIKFVFFAFVAFISFFTGKYKEELKRANENAEYLQKNKKGRENWNDLSDNDKLSWMRLRFKRKTK